MRIIAIIPSRYGSRRFPGKPLAPIAGKPMIQFVYDHAKSCPDVTEVYVATDDERIYRCVRGFGGKAVMSEREHPSGTDRVAEAAQKLDMGRDDVIVNIQGDQPVFQPAVISHLVAPFREDPEIPMGTLRTRMTDPEEALNPNNVKVVTDSDGFALFFSRSPIPFFRDSGNRPAFYKHLGFYAYRPDFLKRFATLPVGQLESAEKLEQLRALEHGYRIKVAETPYDSIEVDAPGDIKKVETLLAESGPP